VLRRYPCADMQSPLPRWDRARVRVAPRNARRRPPQQVAESASHIKLFEAFTAFTLHYGPACSRSRQADPFHRRLQCCRQPSALLRLLPLEQQLPGRSAPPEDRNLCTAHDLTRYLPSSFQRSIYAETLAVSALKPPQARIRTFVLITQIERKLPVVRVP